jgi:hypothetical protein
VTLWENIASKISYLLHPCKKNLLFCFNEKELIRIFCFAIVNDIRTKEKHDAGQERKPYFNLGKQYGPWYDCNGAGKNQSGL